MVKLKDIAEDLDVSPSTVSEVLNDKWKERQISKKLAERVRKRARELGYHPNLLGRQLKLQRTFTIGVIFTDLTKPYSAQILSGLEYIFARNEYGTFICNSLNDPSRELDWLKDILSRRVEGIILEPSSAENSEFLKEMKNKGIPLVLVDTKLEGFKSDFVVTDNFWGAYQGVKFLLGEGHRRIGYLGSVEGKGSVKDRFRGYRSAIGDFGLSVQKELVAEVNGYEDYYKKMKHLLSLEKKPTALFLDSYYYSNGALRAVKEKNIIIPDDLVLCGFDTFDLSVEEIGTLNLNGFLKGVPFRIEQHGYEIGKKAAEILLKRIKEKNSREVSGLDQVFLKPSLEFGKL